MNRPKGIRRPPRSLESLDPVLDVSDMCMILGYTKWWIYKLCEIGVLPHKQPSGKGGKIVFLRDELREWLKSAQESPRMGGGGGTNGKPSII